VKSRILGLLHDARETIAHARLDTGMFCQVALGFIAPLTSQLGKLLRSTKAWRSDRCTPKWLRRSPRV